MDKKKVMTGMVLKETTQIFSFTEVCQSCQIPEELLIELLEHGLFSQLHEPIKRVKFTQEMLDRIQSARRVHQDLDVNLPGVVLVLELHDELEHLRHELNILRRYLG